MNQQDYLSMSEIERTQYDAQQRVLTQGEQEAAQQEAYYFYVIQEFYAICKVFGTAKVMADLKAFKDTVEKPKEEPRIQLL